MTSNEVEGRAGTRPSNVPLPEDGPLDKSQQGHQQGGSDLTTSQSQQEPIRQWNDLSPQEQSQYTDRADYESKTFSESEGLSNSNEGSDKTI